MRLSRFALYAWATVAYNLAVILWGAYVRATGSGAGCGEHWPLCNGVVIPLAPAIETMVEFAHRVTSGIALLSALGLVGWAYRAFPKGHIVRRGAVFSLVFMITEALLGAALVKFEWVADNISIGRVISMPAHLTNTFLLVAALTLTAWWASGGGRPRLAGQGSLRYALFGGLLITLLVGITGAVIALGDTLFFAHINRGGTEETLSPLVESLKQIRIVHPFVAVLSSIVLGVLAWQVRRVRPGPAATPLAWTMTLMLAVQLIVGILNVYLKVPVYMQLIHLLLADLVWMMMVLIAAAALAEPAPQATPAPARLRRSPAA